MGAPLKTKMLFSDPPKNKTYRLSVDTKCTALRKKNFYGTVKHICSYLFHVAFNYPLQSTMIRKKTKYDYENEIVSDLDSPVKIPTSTRSGRRSTRILFLMTPPLFKSRASKVFSVAPPPLIVTR